MSGQQGVEKVRVKEAVDKYFEGKECGYKGLGRYSKKMLSHGTGVYVIQLTVENWPSQHYALVLVARARVQGVIVSDAEEILATVGIPIDGFGEQFSL